MRVLCGFLLLLPLMAAAETAYVTDNLRLGLHQAADTSDRAFRMLESGQSLEILSRDRNYANVQLPDGVQLRRMPVGVSTPRATTVEGAVSEVSA